MQELFLLTALVRAGRPKRYVERYFKIRSDSGAMVPMLYSNEANQEYYYTALLESMERGEEDALCLKDRKARWTSFVASIKAAKMFALPGTHVFWVANAEDTFLTAHELVDGFYHNMPAYAKPTVKGTEWGIERKVLRFPTEDGGELTSTFTLRTANNPSLGSGETPTDAVFDEYGKFPTTFSGAAQASFRAALPPSASFLRGGTVGPQGPSGPMYEEWESIKRGERQTLALFRTWFQNQANVLGMESRLRRPQDREDRDIVPGQNGGVGCEQEPGLVKQFPNDGIPMEWRLARRRAWMVDAMLAAGGPGNEARAKVLFAREHCEDPESPWLVAGSSQFDMDLLMDQIAIARDPANVVVVDEVINGLHFQMWRGYDPEHVYIIGMDFGSGTNQDDTSGQILDATTMVFVGEYHGNVVEPYHACAGGKIVMAKLGNGVWVPETNRFPGIGNHIAKTLGYVNTWRRPRRPGEKMEGAKYYDRSYGFHVGGTHHSEKEPSEEELLGRFKGMFNIGGFKVVNPNLLTAMQRWNPEYDKHTPDRIAGARLAPLGLDDARLLQPVTGEQRDPLLGRGYEDYRKTQTGSVDATSVGVWGYN